MSIWNWHRSFWSWSVPYTWKLEPGPGSRWEFQNRQTVHLSHWQTDGAKSHFLSQTIATIAHHIGKPNPIFRKGSLIVGATPKKNPGGTWFIEWFWDPMAGVATAFCQLAHPRSMAVVLCLATFASPLASTTMMRTDLNWHHDVWMFFFNWPQKWPHHKWIGSYGEPPPKNIPISSFFQDSRLCRAIISSDHR